MDNKGFINRIIEGINDACHVWAQEMKNTLRDGGVLIFFVLVPIAYPLLYSWIYNNEVLREVPVAVVDHSHSSMSRRFIRQCDASPDVRITCYANSIDEAKELLIQQKIKGIYYIPSDFSTRVNRMQQTAVSVYCDMSLMLAYKAVYQTVLAVSQDMNTAIQIQTLGNMTDREDEIATQPLAYEEVPLFNPTGGYGNFILPGVLILILQQTLVLGIGLAAGTARETNRFSELIPISRHYRGVFRIVFGKAMCYFMIYIVIAAYLTIIIPHIFNFVSLANSSDLIGIMLPYLLACIFFGMTVSCLIRHRENVMLLVVFLSVPLLFMSGVSWPQSNILGIWQGVSWLFPSTFGIRAFVRINSMGATFNDVLPEYRVLWIHTAVYFITACIVYRYQIRLSRQKIISRLQHMRHKRRIRKVQKRLMRISNK